MRKSLRVKKKKNVVKMYVVFILSRIGGNNVAAERLTCHLSGEAVIHRYALKTRAAQLR